MKNNWFTGILAIGIVLMYQTVSAYEPETLNLLKKNISAWNAMPPATPGHTIDLSKAPLENADLSNACLVKANLKGAFMKGAKLRDANIHGANLRWCMMENTDLSRANMANTNLFEANLENANLTGTNLKGATFIEQANLSGTTLSNNTILPSGERATLRWSTLHNAKFVSEAESALPTGNSSTSLEDSASYTSGTRTA